MKIAVASEFFPPYLAGGGERRYYEILKRIAKKHEVQVYTMKIEGAPLKETIDKIHVHRVGITHPRDRRKYLPLLFYYLALKNEMSKQDFDLFDGNAYISAMSGYYVAKYKNKPKVATIHDVYGERWGDYTHPLLGPVGKWIERNLLKLNFDKFIAVSGSTKKLLIENGVDEKKIEIIHNGVDAKKFSNVKVKREKGKFVYVGRLVEQKNVGGLLRAFKIVHEKKPDSKLVLVGSGVGEKHFLCMARDIGLSDSVEFRGFVEANELVKEVASASALVNPSKQEGFGLVLLEAMGAGTPVVAYDIPAYEDFAKNGQNALLAKQHNSKALAKQMLKALDKKTASKLILNGKKTVKKFAWDRAANETEALYKKMLSEVK
ncbi:glycosyltransferase family 4 protein [Candidatus Undinarchaeota archaeon]